MVSATAGLACSALTFADPGTVPITIVMLFQWNRSG
jgi:hypothetical protein